MDRLSPSSTSLSLKADAQAATAKVIRRAYHPRFQADVADELGVSPDIVSRVVVEGIPDTHLVEVKTDIPDPVLAARVVNAVARKLADDFKTDADIRVRVVDTARSPSLERKLTEK